MTTLFDPLRVGALELRNRIVMAPLTRCRAPGHVPTALMAQYYAQRADAGLIVSEATQVCPEGRGYADTPGIHSEEQVVGWRLVTDAVHARGGRIVAQLWHVGRISHAWHQPGGAAPVSSTARAANAKSLTGNGFEPCSAPRALREDEIPAVVAAYAHAARCALAAGFDGVEVHGANGYLVDQFLRDSINDRGDGYGGPVSHRIRFALEVMRAVTQAVGGERTGLRLSPVSPVNDAGFDSDPQALFGALIDALAPLRLAFLHVIEGQTGGVRDVSGLGAPALDYAALRRRFSGAWMVNNGYDAPLAQRAVADGQADVVAFGRAFISNPDLVRRLRAGAPLARADSSTFYRGGERGYIDYPSLAAQEPAA